MSALAYAGEIEAQYDCADCARSQSEWDRRGRCLAPIPGGEEQLRIEVADSKGGWRTTSKAYPVAFSTCPRGLTRSDLNPDGCAVAAIVSQASHADVKHRWPDIPARLWSLTVHYDGELAEKRGAYQEAAMERR